MESTDLVIVGSGPAGLSAAIYTARAGIKTMVFGCRPKYAGDYDIDNYFGYPETISGKDLQDRGMRQAERFGAQIVAEQVLGIHPAEEEGGGFVVKTMQREVACAAIILATGVSRTKPAIKNLADYEGKGVSYCVSCDGFFYRGKPVVVVGEANFAANQALELTQYTPNVTICSNGKPLTMDPAFGSRLSQANIPVVSERIERLEGQGGLESIVLEGGTHLPAYGLFVAMGEASSTDFAYSLGVERKGQFIVADYDQLTNVPGVFAAGDCIGGFMQIAVAVGEGAKAGRAAISFVRQRQKKAGAAQTMESGEMGGK